MGGLLREFLGQVLFFGKHCDERNRCVDDCRGDLGVAVIRVRKVEREPTRALRRPKYGWGRRSWEVYLELFWLAALGVGVVAFADWVRAVWDATIG